MAPVVVVLLIVLVVGIFIAGAILAARAERQRRAGLRAVARKRDFDYDEAGGDPDIDPYCHFELFSQGDDRQLSNTFTGELLAHGRRLAAIGGDHHWETTSGSGSDRKTTSHDCSYLIVRLPVAATPDLAIRREGLLDKIAGVLGFDDIDFESEEFSRRFHVESSDKRFAWDVFHPRMLELFLGGQELAIMVHEGHALFLDGEQCWSPQEFDRCLDFAQRFFQLWPEHLLVALETKASGGK